MRGLAFRRHQDQRIKAKTRRKFKEWHMSMFILDLQYSDRNVGVEAARHFRPCSKSCCGNPRRHFGEKTLQERRIEQEIVDY